MSHRCEDCGAEFATLSKLRLHDCAADRKKQADRISFEGFATHEDGTPVAMFTVALEEGMDMGTTFDLAFAVINDETGANRFAFMSGNNNPIATLDYDDELEDFLDKCLDKEEYITAINYENTELELPDGREVGFILTGRRLGSMFDHTDRDPLPPTMLNTIRDIKQTLEDNAAEEDGVAVKQVDESDSFPPFRDEAGATVLELAVTNPEQPTPHVIKEQRGLRGDFEHLVLVAGAPKPPTDRSVAVEPLPEETQADRYLRVTFDYDRRADVAAMYATAVKQGQVDLRQILDPGIAASLLDSNIWK